MPRHLSPSSPYRRGGCSSTIRLHCSEASPFGDASTKHWKPDDTLQGRHCHPRWETGAQRPSQGRVGWGATCGCVPDACTRCILLTYSQLVFCGMQGDQGPLACHGTPWPPACSLKCCWAVPASLRPLCVPYVITTFSPLEPSPNFLELPLPIYSISWKPGTLCLWAIPVRSEAVTDRLGSAFQRPRF